MGKQIVLFDGFEVIPPPEMNNLLLFGSDQSVSNCGESTTPITEEDGTPFSGESSPGGVAATAAEEECNKAKPFSFYVVKHQAYDPPEIQAKIDEADREIYRVNKLRIEVSNAQKSERAEESSGLAEIKGLARKPEEYRVAFEEKKKEFESLLEALRNLRCSSSDQLCFSKEELDHLISIAYYQIDHGSIGLEEEAWTLKKFTKPDGISLSEESLLQKEASINSIKSMAMELNELKTELLMVTWKINLLTDKLGKSQNKIRVLDARMTKILEQRDKLCERIKKLRMKRDKGNAAYFQSLSVKRKAKELAASGNVGDLEVFASSEVDRFMSLWNNDKAFRDDYIKRISISLCKRKLSQDGRRIVPEVRVPKQQATLDVKGKQKVHETKKENSSSNSSRDGNVLPEVRVVPEQQATLDVNGSEKVQKKSSNSSQDGNVLPDKPKKQGRNKAKDINKSTAEESGVTDFEFPVYENPKKEEEEVDEETLKERKREEQIEKARLAMERKRKLQEKAAAKAAIRSQKEAEKKLKECEKKAKKKAAANALLPSEADQSREVISEQEKSRALAVSAKEKQQKEKSLYAKQRSFRYKHRRTGTEAIPKAILNRRRARKYWVWGISSAAVVLALCLLVLLLR